MFAHILSLIIQNRFHLLLKLLLLSIRNSWSDALSAPLFVAAVSFFVARAKFQVGVLAGRSRSKCFSVWKIYPCDWIYSRRSCVCCSVPFAWEIARDSPIVNIVSQTMNKQVSSSWILWSLMGSLSVEYCPERKNAPWRQTTVWRHGIHK